MGVIVLRTAYVLVPPLTPPSGPNSMHLQVKHPLRDWRKLGECQKFIQHGPEGGGYGDVRANSQGLLAVTDGGNKCVHLLTKEGALVRSIGKGVLSGLLCGVSFDLKGNVLVTDYRNNIVVKLSQDGRLLQTIRHASSESDHFVHPLDVSVSPDGLIYICDSGNRRVTIHVEGGNYLYSFGSEGPRQFVQPCDIAVDSDGLVYVTDTGNKTVSVWSKGGSFRREFKPKYAPTCIAATSDNHLLITSDDSHTVMIYTLKGELVHEFGEKGSDPGRFSGPVGICVDDNGVVYVADWGNCCVQVF